MMMIDDRCEKLQALATAIVLTLILLFFVGRSNASTSTLTGTIVDEQGNPINGTLVMRLPVPAQDTTTNSAVAPSPVYFRLVNGVITGGLPLFDVANLQPQGLYYTARAYDQTGNLAFYGNYVVTGATFNLGAAVPTSVTTSNISYLTPASQNGNNTFTGNNTFLNVCFSGSPAGYCLTGSSLNQLLWSGDLLIGPPNNAVAVNFGPQNNGQTTGNTLNLNGGVGTTTASGGNVNVTGGSGGATGGLGGNVVITGGASPAGGNAGSVILNAAAGGSIQLQTKMSLYNNVSLAGNGAVADFAQINLTAQTANIGATTFFSTVASTSPSAVNFFRVSCYAVVTTAATTSSTLPSVVINYTDLDSGAAETITCSPTSSSNTLGQTGQGVFILNAKNTNISGTAIQYSTTGYASTGATAMQYAIHIRLEAI